MTACLVQSYLGATETNNVSEPADDIMADPNTDESYATSSDNHAVPAAEQCTIDTDGLSHPTHQR